MGNNYFKRLAVDMPPQVKDKLEQLAEKDGRRQNEIIRSLIVEAHRQEFTKKSNTPK